MGDYILKWFPLIFGVGIVIVFGWVVISGLAGHIRERRRQARRRAGPRGHFVFAKIRDHVGPMERAERYQRPLDQDLEAHGFGMVMGGGTQLDTNNGVEWIALDLELTNLEQTLEFTRRRLRELGAPKGSLLEYEIDGQTKTVLID